MTRRKKETLRALCDDERKVLEQISRSDREPAGQVAHAKGLLAVAAGKTYIFGFSIHDDFAHGRFHQVSLGYTLGIGIDADVKASHD